MDETKVRFLPGPSFPMSLTVQTRHPPSTVIDQAEDIRDDSRPARVTVEPDGSGGWRLIAEGNAERDVGPPADTPSKWDEDVPGLSENKFDEFNSFVESLTEDSRKQITKTYDPADRPGSWRTTVNYDDPRGP